MCEGGFDFLQEKDRESFFFCRQPEAKGIQTPFSAHLTKLRLHLCVCLTVKNVPVWGADTKKYILSVMLSMLLIFCVLSAPTPSAQLPHCYLVHGGSPAACLECFLCLQPGLDGPGSVAAQGLL